MSIGKILVCFQTDVYTSAQVLSMSCFHVIDVIVICVLSVFVVDGWLDDWDVMTRLGTNFYKRQLRQAPSGVPSWYKYHKYTFK